MVMMGQVVVTGNHGLIGHCVGQMLAESGYSVVGVARRAEPGHAGAATVGIDLAAPDALRSLELLGPVAAVVHCAASLPASFFSPLSDVVAEKNRAMDQAVFEFCRRRGARLIYCSGTSIYAQLGRQPARVGDPLYSDDGYLREKIWAEQEIRDTLDSFVILRICAPYGPRQSSRTVLRTFIERALRGEDILFYGSGTREQDFIHAQDVALAVKAALVHDDVNDTFNISGGSPIRMRDLGAMVIKVLGRRGISARAAGQPDPQEGCYARFDLSPAQALLGWKPSIPLVTGIAEMAAHMAEGMDATRANL
ncbi:NAD(P)-dependent oxidoreductase [Achromobacter mucicolens]|uniref:NAD-dependent epimerase/dehydratase family protein n=1 Tax=Achromobacter mucicolens TaxID=1389922 RepID=UPI00244C39B4|nr:NAD(P)-dependent oxidoreductase [Achromobacter mucicolens]MDH0089853.1 NAD(P)-dependent oxidoreductase [Achromobacter mucicolens]